MLLYKNIDKYKKNHISWSFSEINIPKTKKDDLLTRLSTGDKHSFFSSAMTSETLLSRLPQDRILSVMDKKNRLMEEMDFHVVFQYLSFMFQRFMIEFEYYLSGEMEVENLQDFCIEKKLFDIIQEKLIQEKDCILTFFQKNSDEILNSESKLEFMGELLYEIYKKVAEKEIKAVMESEYSEKIKEHYIENIKKTLNNIMILIGNMVFEDFLEEVQDKSFDKSPENLFFLYKMLFPSENLLIVKIKQKKDQDEPKFVLLEDIPFEKYIDTKKSFKVVLFFPETNTYERIIIESFQKGSDSIEQSKKYPYKYYNFPSDHPFIKMLLKNLL